MTSSKRDTELLFKLISNFIVNLTNEQYLQLVSGEAEIKLKAKKLDSETLQFYKELLQKIIGIENVKSRSDFLLSHMSKKSDLLNFHNYLNIPYKNRDTVQTLVNNIVEYTLKNEDYLKINNTQERQYEEQLEELSVQLQEIMDIDEAKKLLKESPLSNRKNELLDFAKQLSVFPDKRMNSEDIINEIVKSVVEAKLRSYKIRKKI